VLLEEASIIPNDGRNPPRVEAREPTRSRIPRVLFASRQLQADFSLAL
jgi:hypothetical protein